jgi:hypothetical protein
VSIIEAGRRTTTRWACCRCGAAGVRNLGAFGYCATHLAELFDQFDPATFSGNGVGLLTGRMLHEFGPLVGELTCNAPDCGATWADIPGAACPWCRDRRHQREGWLSEPIRRWEIGA